MSDTATALFVPLGLDHVVLRVRDQEASRRFYMDVLGCTLDHVNEPIRLIHLRFGDALIDLLPRAAGEPGEGMDHFCLSRIAGSRWRGRWPIGAARSVAARPSTCETRMATRSS
jgi:catechol 2,3-dioxygenase-like lactoylglutathione lyase family enzyme